MLHLALTTPEAAERATALARENGVKVETHGVQRSFSELQRQADGIRRGGGPLSTASRGQVGIDVKTNRVVVAVPAAQRPGSCAAGEAASVTVIEDPQLQSRPIMCAGRDVCDGSIAAGAMLWRGRPAPSYALSASPPRTRSCSGASSTPPDTARTESASTGAPARSRSARYSIRSTSMTSTPRVIQVTNAFYTGQPGGRLYNTVDVDDVALDLASITIGDVVCLAANFQDPTGARSAVRSVASATQRSAAWSASTTRTPAPATAAARGTNSRQHADCGTACTAAAALGATAMPADRSRGSAPSRRSSPASLPVTTSRPVDPNRGTCRRSEIRCMGIRVEGPPGGPSTRNMDPRH